MQRKQQSAKASSEFARKFLMEYSKIKMQNTDMVQAFTWTQINDWIHTLEATATNRAVSGKQRMKKYWSEKHDDSISPQIK